MAGEVLAGLREARLAMLPSLRLSNDTETHK